jgi:hypothetical protein
MTGLHAYCDDIEIRRVIVTVSEIATVVEAVIRINPFIDYQLIPVDVPAGEAERVQDLIAVDRR